MEGMIAPRVITMMLKGDCVYHHRIEIYMHKQTCIFAAFFFLFISCSSLGNSRYDPSDLQEGDIIQMNTGISFENLLPLDRYPFDLELVKNKYTLINFWGTWCPYCESDRSSLQLLHEMSHDNFVILTISLGEDAETVHTFMTKNNYSFPVLLDTKMTLKAEFAQFVPVSYIMNPDGLIIARIEGNRKWNSEQSLKVLQYMGWYTEP
jgi:thiol-disulfide isomerase/thioredoxin